MSSLDQLLDFPWVSYQTDRAFLDTIMVKIEAATGRRREASVTSDSLLAALNLLHTGNYLSFLPASFITTVTGFDLTVISTPLPVVDFQSGMLYRQSLKDSTLLECFRGEVAERIRLCNF